MHTAPSYNHITEAILAVTYRCNSRCIMCNIWQITDFEGEIKPEDYASLPANLRDINISGGEPFLRPELPEMIRVVRKRCPKANIVISTNGFSTDIIVRQTKKILQHDPEIGVALSIDGLQQKHDEVRRIPDGFNKIMRTITGLKEIGVKHLKISFTIGDYNIEDFKKVYELSRELGMEFTSTAVHSSDNYFAIKNDISRARQIAEQFDWLIRQELRSWHYKRWARAFFYYGLREFLMTGKRILPDYSGARNVFIDPTGNVYPSNVSTTVVGHLRPSFEITKSVCGERASENSWMMCTVRQSLKRHWFRVGMWILRNKFTPFKSAYTVAALTPEGEALSVGGTVSSL